MMELDEVWSERLSKWQREIHQTKKILIPVIINQLLTLAGWYFVYNCETDPNSLAYYLLDSRHNFTTGSDIYDGALNGAICVSLLAGMSFFMLLVAIYNFKRLIKAWLSISCLLIVFGISALFARDVFEKIGVTENLWIWTILAAGIYGAGGVAVFFSEKCPLWLHQLYVVTNCAIVSLYYLRMLPAHTTWFLLLAIILWDAFAVLAPQGPLNLITGCAENYSDNILRFLMFTAEIQPNLVTPIQESSTTIHDVLYKTHTKLDKVIEEDEEDEEFDEELMRILNKNDDDDGCTTADSFTEEELDEGDDEEEEIVVDDEKRERTAKDALDDDNSIRLGLGDFVFYSVLVGKAASSGSFLATLAAMNGVVLGLVITLTVFSDSDETMPALPCSIALGMFFHFSSLYIIQPFYYGIYSLLYLLFSEAIIALESFIV